MTWFRDLEKCSYFGKPLENVLVAVGWLSADKDYTKGKVTKADFQLVVDFCNAAPLIYVFRGFHECEFCEPVGVSKTCYTSSGEKLFGKRWIAKKPIEKNGIKSISHLNIFVPFGEKIIVSPENLPHYIKKHCYKPPDEFFEALRNSPSPGTLELSNALVKIGGASFATRRKRK